MLSLIPAPWRLAVLVAAVSAIAGFIYMKGRADRDAADLKREVRELRERSKDDAKIRSLDDYALCVEYVGRVSECEQLRPVREE